MNTEDIMRLALGLSGLSEIPADSAILNSADNVNRVLLGIDIREEDLRRASAEAYDLVIAHHPLGGTGFISVLDRHEELMLRAGVARDIAKETCRRHKATYEERAASRPPDEKEQRLRALAEELGLGLMNIHTPCDEIGRRRLQQVVDNLAEPTTVLHLMETYSAIPEMVESDEEVELVCGRPQSALEKTVVIHGAGTNGGYPVSNTLFESGVGTVVYIHLHGQQQKARLAQEGKGNLILTGHYASDSLGINPVIDALEDAGIEVDCCNNMIRIKRDRTE